MNPLKRIALLLMACFLLAACSPRQVPPSSEATPPPPALPNLPVFSLTASEGETLALPAYGQQYTLPDGSPLTPEVAATEDIVLTLDTPIVPAFSCTVPLEENNFTLTYDGQELLSGSLEQLADFVPTVNGDYILNITLGWQQPDFMGDASYRLVLRYQMQPVFEVGTGSVPMGDPLVLWVKYAAPDTTVTASTNLNFTPQFFDYDGSKVALLPIHPGTKPGDYYVELTSGESSARLAVKVSETQFEVQHIQVPQSVASSTINSNKANDEYAAKIGPVRTIADPVKHWDGVFEPPIHNYERISSEYGLTRYYNDNPNPDRHNGIDFPCAVGTPVYAPQAGRVVFSQFLQLTGHTMVIEHGLGLKSWYYHMEKRVAVEGQLVQTGDVIGEVGSTGFSTGPHLHFGMSVNNVFINPWTMFDNALLD